MRSIKTKLIVSSSLMILAAILIVAIPTLRNQYSVLNENITENASLQISAAADSIDAFFNTPKTIVKDVSYYVQRSDLDLETTEKDFENMIKGMPALYCLYYADEKPMNAGGNFYSSDGWIPEDDYNKETRDWYAGPKKNNGVLITEPYVDEDTGYLVSTIATSVRENGVFRGVVGIDVFLSDLNAMMERIKLTKDGKTFLIDANGYYLTNEDASKVQNAKFFDEYSNLTDYKNKINTSEVFLETRAAGGNYIAGTIINKDAGWLLVTVGSTSAIFAKLQHNINLVVVMAVIALIVSVIIGIIVSSSIVKPIKVVDTAVNGIAEGNANLTQRLKASSRDEVGHLVNGFNKFMEKLHGIVSDVKSSKNNLADVKIDLQESIDSTASAITEILSNIESVGGQVAQQVASVNQTSAAVTEIAENINSLEKMISTQSDGVTQASAAVEEMLGNISSVNHSVEMMSNSFNSLETAASDGIQKQQKVSEQVAEIAAQSEALQDANIAITNVASQTNLLAMNAAIEAAHAGEAGKGFSVVADEIRKLSETSASESKKISEELRKISETISSMVVTARESSETFAGVSEKISQTDQLVEQIKAAMEEQQIGSQQIVDALKLMNDSTGEVKNASHEMAIGNQAILTEIHNLQDATQVIKDGMNEMSIGAKEMNQTSAALSEISSKVNESINQIGTQIDQFQV